MRWYRLGTASLASGAVVIDATEASDPFWSGPVVSLLEELRDRLSTPDLPEVVYLGGREAHPLATVLAPLLGERGAGGNDPRQQLGRFPVIGPFLREWFRAPPRPVVLVTNTSVVDLEDWACGEVIGSLLVYRLSGSDRLSPAPFREVGPECELGVVVNHISDPPVAVEIGGGAFAIDWEGAELNWADGTLRSTGILPTGPFLLAHPDQYQPGIDIRRGSGNTVKLSLVPAAAPPPRQSVSVSAAEANVLRLWRSGKQFFCGICGTGHLPGQAWCAGADRTLLPTLLGHPRGTAWVVTENRGGWTATPHPRGVYPLSDGRVAACTAGSWEVFEVVRDQWRRTTAPERLITLDDGQLLLPS